MATVPAKWTSLPTAKASSSPNRSSPLAGLRITLSGLLVLVVSILVLIASFTAEANLFLLLFGIAAGVMGVNLVVCVRTVRYIDVERTIGPAAMADRPLRITYHVRSRRRFMRSWAIHVTEASSRALGVSLSGGFVTMLEPGAEQRLELATICPHRGHLNLRAIRLACGFPFGLFVCQVDVEAPAELMVYPAVGRVRREIWKQRSTTDSLASQRTDRGAAEEEFHGVREYRHGDNPRWIHWRRSAHAGQLVVREHRALRDSAVMVLLDPWPGPVALRPAGRGVLGHILNGPVELEWDADAERIISAAATAVCEALDRGHRVGLVARGSRPVALPPAGGRAHRQRLLTEMALLSPGGVSSLDQLMRAIRWPPAGSARSLLFAGRTDGTHHRVLRALSNGTENILLVSPQSGWLDKLFDLPAVSGPKWRASS